MSKVTVYLFTSPTCGPCKTIKPFWSEMKEDDTYGAFNWVTVDITADPQKYVQAFGVAAVPAMVVTIEGRVLGQWKGTTATGYLQLLRSAAAAVA